jgi:hypothetical protein
MQANSAPIVGMSIWMTWGGGSVVFSEHAGDLLQPRSAQKYLWEEQKMHQACFEPPMCSRAVPPSAELDALAPPARISLAFADIARSLP